MLKLTKLGSSSHGNCIIIECDTSSIMLDCGLHWKEIYDNVDVNKLDGVFITHRHSDHCKGAEGLSYYTTCNFYMNQEAYDKLKLHCKKVIVDKIVDLKDFKILCFEVYHDVQNTNFLILHKESGTKILYITDTSDISNLHFKDIDFFIVEGNFSREWDLTDMKYKRTNSDYGHLAIEDTINFLSKNVNGKTKKVFISHISYSFENIYEFADKVDKAFDGKLDVVAFNNKGYTREDFILDYIAK